MENLIQILEGLDDGSTKEDCGCQELPPRESWTGVARGRSNPLLTGEMVRAHDASRRSLPDQPPPYFGPTGIPVPTSAKPLGFVDEDRKKYGYGAKGYLIAHDNRFDGPFPPSRYSARLADFSVAGIQIGWSEIAIGAGAAAAGVAVFLLLRAKKKKRSAPVAGFSFRRRKKRK